MNVRQPWCPDDTEVGFPYCSLPFGVTSAEVAINCLDNSFIASSISSYFF